MAWLSRFRGRKSSEKVVVIGLDGVPFSLITGLLRQGELPNLARMVKSGSLVETHSVLPTVSSVAWSSFMTGKNPAKHNIYGFVERSPDSYDIFIPNSNTMGSDTLWEILGRAGKRVIVMNVPVTYPPREVNGILVAGFLAPTLERGVYPPDLAKTLAGMGYLIDSDPWVARESKDKFLEDLRHILAKREEALFYLLQREEWDFLMMHIMETDRLHHFLWEHMENQDPIYAEEFVAFYRLIDLFLGRVYDRVREEATVIVMSDHGFCTLKKEVYINYWLAQNGWLKYKTSSPKSLADIHPDSKAYSLDPGRMYINLRGREPAGSVEQGAEYEAVRAELAQGLEGLQDPDTGEPMVERVVRREEIYSGRFYEGAPDLILIPRRGYDPKGSFGTTSLTHKGALEGMHTFDDAMLYIGGHRVIKDTPLVMDVMPTILGLMGVEKPADIDGVTLI